MERRTLNSVFFLFAALALFGLLAIMYMRAHKAGHTELSDDSVCKTDLVQILERGRLDVSLGYNSLNYYILHGKPGGFQFELAKHFADFLGVELNIMVSNDIRESTEALKSGKIDILCGDFTKIPGRFGSSIVFSNPWAYVYPVLVQREDHPENQVIRNIEELSGKIIHVPVGTYFKQIIMELSSELKNPPVVIEISGYGSEQLIDAVAAGKINLTVADHHLANYHVGLYRHLDAEFMISGEQPLAWCMRKTSSQLREKFNIWLEEFMKTRKFKYFYHRYFINPWKKEKTKGEFFSVKSGSISPHDEAIRKHSSEIGWDWRLVAALIYEESRFKHDLVSYGGAFGIMQMMPVTAEKFGVGPDSSPEEHIRAGTKFLQRLDHNFIDAVPDSTERKKFVLAAYNLGEGHVRDAIALSEKHRRNPQLWENNVEYFLIAKSQSRYYRDNVVKNGYCKGIVTSVFVKNILTRYEHYKNAFPEY
jgi:membrane-bound lytic murein transglycosylase F